MNFETSLREVIPRTSDVCSFRFPKPSGFNYKPGQYMMVTIKVNGQEVTKPLTISSSPTQPFLEFTKKLTDSQFSNALRAMKVGDWFRLDAPHGIFTFMGEHPKVAFLAGGIGITPFKSIIQYCTDTRQKASILLFYGCRNQNEMVFKSEFEEMQNKNPDLKVIFVLNEASNQWTGKKGVINSELIKTCALDYKERTFYACGPPGMVIAMQKLVADLGLPSNQLKLEALVGHI